jgi:hypothetical protein
VQQTNPLRRNVPPLTLHGRLKVQWLTEDVARVPGAPDRSLVGRRSLMVLAPDDAAQDLRGVSGCKAGHVSACERLGDTGEGG